MRICYFRLASAGIPVRFVTNETQSTREAIHAKLQNIGFTITEEHIFPPAPACVKVLKEKNLRPHLLVHPDVRLNFKCIIPNPLCFRELKLLAQLFFF